MFKTVQAPPVVRELTCTTFVLVQVQVSAARAYPVKCLPEVKIEVNVEHAPANTLAKKKVSLLDSRNLNDHEKVIVKSVGFAAVICLQATLACLRACLPACLPALPTCLPACLHP